MDFALGETFKVRKSKGRSRSCYRWCGRREGREKQAAVRGSVAALTESGRKGAAPRLLDTVVTKWVGVGHVRLSPETRTKPSLPHWFL